VGALTWQVEQQWEGSVEASLAAAQKQILASDAIFGIVGTRAVMESAVDDVRELGVPELTEPVEAALARLDDEGRPASAADARHLMGLVDHCTGTILDVDGVRDEPRAPQETPPEFEGFFVSPLPDDLLQAHYGSTMPTPDTCRTVEFPGRLNTYDGRYIIAYTDQQPSTIFFYGDSAI
jgi:hypothetical protein